MDDELKQIFFALIWKALETYGPQILGDFLDLITQLLMHLTGEDRGEFIAGAQAAITRFKSGQPHTA